MLNNKVILMVSSNENQQQFDDSTIVKFVMKTLYM